MVEATEVTSPSNNTVDDGSDVSDIEEEGYCDSSEIDNINMSMKLEPVRESRIKKLYANTEKVSITVTAELKQAEHVVPYGAMAIIELSTLKASLPANLIH